MMKNRAAAQIGEHYEIEKPIAGIAENPAAPENFEPNLADGRGLLRARGSVDDASGSQPTAERHPDDSFSNVFRPVRARKSAEKLPTVDRIVRFLPGVKQVATK
jgi:hypothetical protein